MGPPGVHVVIYFAQAGEDGPIKIGYSNNPERRAKQLKYDDKPCRLLSTRPGNFLVKQAIHRALWSHRIQGEWFRPVAQVLEAQTAPLPLDAPAPDSDPPLTSDAAIDADQVAKLRDLVTAGGKGLLLADFAGVGNTAMARALAGLPVRPATRALIRLGLERLVATKNSLTVAEARAKQSDPYHPDPAINAEVVADRDEGRAVDASAGIREGWHRGWKPGGAAQPACPRCLDLEPGTPGGEPETPHPGPFTDTLCAACAKAVKS